MAEALKLRVEKRDPAKNKGTGSRASRKIRAAGRVPAVIYGHKLPVVPVSLTKRDVEFMMEAAGHLAELDVEGTAETVLIREVQWDYLGREIIHVDFERVDRTEEIETAVTIEVRGEPAGAVDGGLLQQILHELTVRGPAGSIPDGIQIDVSELNIGDGVQVGDIELPEGVEPTLEPEVLIVNVTPPVHEEEEEEEEAEGEPEVIQPDREEEESE